MTRRREAWKATELAEAAAAQEFGPEHWRRLRQMPTERYFVARLADIETALRQMRDSGMAARRAIPAVREALALAETALPELDHLGDFEAPEQLYLVNGLLQTALDSLRAAVKSVAVLGRESRPKTRPILGRDRRGFMRAAFAAIRGISTRPAAWAYALIALDFDAPCASAYEWQRRQTDVRKDILGVSRSPVHH